MQRTEAASESPDSRPDERVEDVHLRNYDFDRAYDLELVVEDGDETVLSRRFYARPGWSRSLSECLPAGDYEIVVSLDGQVTERGRCRIGDDPDDSVLIECGNGCVSITQGLY